MTTKEQYKPGITKNTTELNIQCPHNIANIKRIILNGRTIYIDKLNKLTKISLQMNATTSPELTIIKLLRRIPTQDPVANYGNIMLEE